MKRFHFRHLLAVLTTLATMCMTSAASAQYVWIDEKGTKQYSDIPPPPSVPQSRILKHGGRVLAPPAEATPPGAPTQAALTTAEKDAEFRKRRAEQVEKEKKAAEQAKLAADKAKNCERAREYSKALESGERMARTDKNGERSFLTDEQRTQELRDTRRVLDDCK